MYLHTAQLTLFMDYLQVNDSAINGKGYLSFMHKPFPLTINERTKRTFSLENWTHARKKGEKGEIKNRYYILKVILVLKLNITSWSSFLLKWLSEIQQG